MSNLRELKNRIASVRSTRKITLAMKMVAASRLRRAEQMVSGVGHYSVRLERMIARVQQTAAAGGGSPFLATREPAGPVRLVVVTSDRGLCGGLNPGLIRRARQRIRALQQEGQEVQLFLVGKKGRDGLLREHHALIVESVQDIARQSPDYHRIAELADQLAQAWLDGEFARCELIHPRFVSTLTQTVHHYPYLPLTGEARASGKEEPEEPEAQGTGQGTGQGGGSPVEMEPSEDELLQELVPFYLRTRLFEALVQCYACEQAARVTAMDNASRNASDMIDRLTLDYNRTRQAAITSELIEIISGAEAL